MRKYEKILANAIRQFWATRQGQLKKQKKYGIADQGSRGAVTGGKQLDGFLELLAKISIDAGVPRECIFTKNSVLPGYFRPTKEWDFIVISPKKHLLACIELKSQVGSFGNNFNNRTEEALGSAIDIWTAYREGGFPDQPAPWLGFLMIAERSGKSTAPVKLEEPHFKTRKEFGNSSYLERYQILCRKMMRERLYTQACLIWTQRNGKGITYGHSADELSFNSFVLSYLAYLKGRKNEFRG